MKLNRRSFLSTTGAFIAYSSLVSCQAGKSKTKNPSKKSLGIALVGLGSYSRGQLAPALQLTKHCHLAGIVTGSPEKIPIWQEKYNIADENVYNYDNMGDIANNDQIDVIYIVVPTGVHAKYAIKAAKTGKHVWCEKPMAMDVEECQQIISACATNKVRLAIGYRMKHESNTKKLISFKHSKPYGEINSVFAEACYAGGQPSGWRAVKAMGGGAMYDMGVYTVNGIIYATGQEPIAVSSAKHIIHRPEMFKEVDEETIYELEFASGIKVKGRTSVGKPGNQLRVDCENGWYKLSPMQAYNGVVGETSDGIQLDTFVESQQAIQMDDDALAIMNDAPFIATGQEGMRDIGIIEAIFKSAASGERVIL